MCRWAGHWRVSACLSRAPTKRVSPARLPACLQVQFKFANREHQDGVEYSITAIAWNEFGESAASEEFEYTTPRKPFQPVIDSIFVEPFTGQEPYGSITVTIDEVDDGGSGEQRTAEACACCHRLAVWLSLRCLPAALGSGICPFTAVAVLPWPCRDLAVHRVWLGRVRQWHAGWPQQPDLRGHGRGAAGRPGKLGVSAGCQGTGARLRCDCCAKQMF